MLIDRTTERRSVREVSNCDCVVHKVTIQLTTLMIAQTPSPVNPTATIPINIIPGMMRSSGSNSMCVCSPRVCVVQKNYLTNDGMVFDNRKIRFKNCSSVSVTSSLFRSAFLREYNCFRISYMSILFFSLGVCMKKGLV